MSSQAVGDAELILVYYNFKGIGQVIRLLLCYLELPFADIYIDEYEKQKPALPEKVRLTLQQHPVAVANLPALIHQGAVIYELNQIMTYICRAFDREDLLGTSLHLKSQVCEIMEIYSQKIVPSIAFLRNYVSEVYESPLFGVELLGLVERRYLQLLQESGYVEELTTYLLKQEQQRFIFGDLTLIDFYFFQGARLTLTLFGAIDYQTASPRWTETAKAYKAAREASGGSIRKVEVLRAIKKYEEFFVGQPFYAKHMAYLQKFNILGSNLSQAFVLGLKKLWANDEKYLHY